MKRLLSFIVLLGFGSVAYANGHGNAFNPITAGPDTDVAIMYLGQIFGHVPGALDGDGSGMMSQLFYVFNQGVMVVAAAWLVYSISNVMLSGGLTSQGFQKHSIAMISFRVAAGMLLLIPNPTNGYSSIQTLMMKVVVEGSRLADTTWNYALDYLQNGGVIYSPQTSSGNMTPDDVSHYMTSKTEAKGVISDVLQDEVCMYASNNYMKKHPDDPYTKHAAGNFDMIPVPVQNDMNALVPGTGQVDFPGLGDISGMENRGHACGSVAVPVQNLQGGSASAWTYEFPDAYQALYQMALDLQPLAKSIAHSDTDDMMSNRTGGQYIMRAIRDYVTLMQPVTGFMQKQNNQDKAKFIGAAEQQGWFNAGSFYWNVSRLNDSMSNREDAAKIIPKTTVTWNWPQSILNSKIGHKMKIYNNRLNAGIWSNGYDQIMNYIQTMMSNSAQGVQKSGVHSEDKHHHHFLWIPTTVYHTPAFDTQGVDKDNMLGWALVHMTNTFQSIMFSNSADSYDPLVFVQVVGKSCLSEAGNLWSNAISYTNNMAAEMTGCSAFFGGCAPLASEVAWVVPMITAAAGMLFTAGFMLNFYVPLYPYLLFMFGAIGWLLAVVEAMVAAPLVAFGMTHPEGHDFMGKAEQALMLALGVFIRPALMVIGFVAGMLLSYVAFDFINAVIGRVFISAFSGSVIEQNSTTNVAPLDSVWIVINGGVNNGEHGTYTGSGLADFILIPLLLVSYGMIMIEVVNQCFSAIHQVPDMVLRWIGGPQMNDQSEKYAQAIKQGMQHSAQQAGQVVGQALQGQSKAKMDKAQMEGQMIGKVTSSALGAAEEE